MVVTLAGEPALKGRDLLVICDGFVDDRVPTHSFILARGGRSLSLGPTDAPSERLKPERNTCGTRPAGASPGPRRAPRPVGGWRGCVR